MHALFCAAGGPTDQDFILTPTEAGAVNALLAQMNAHILAEAQRRQFAFFALQELYGRPDVKGPFNVFACAVPNGRPYGAFISLDGVHPTAALRFSPKLLHTPSAPGIIMTSPAKPRR